MDPNGSEYADELMHVNVTHVKRNTCGGNYSPLPITDNMICAADPGEDSCQGTLRCFSSLHGGWLVSFFSFIFDTYV